MSLSSVGYPAWNTIRGVRFTMLYGQTLVPVLVTHDALDDIERDPPALGGHLACFNIIAKRLSTWQVRSTRGHSLRKVGQLTWRSEI